MNTPDIWKRADLHFPANFDTIFFDVDGVLIKTTDSFRATDIAVAEYIVGTFYGLNWGEEGRVLVSLADVKAFKQAGGFNNDWYLSYLLTALSVARLREWSGTELAERSMQDWAALARVAQLQGRGGLTWIEDIIPASALPDYQIIQDVFLEYYWGAQGVRKYFGREPLYLPQEQGLVHRETLLFSPDFFARLRAAGIKHLGMITGRVGPEVDSALERIEAYCGTRWWDVVVSADLYVKPDPQALRFAINAVSAQSGLYIGDTADDLDVVLGYRAVKKVEEPDMLAAMLLDLDKEEDSIYQQRGADVIVRSVEMLLEFLPVHPSIQAKTF